METIPLSIYRYVVETVPDEFWLSLLGIAVAYAIFQRRRLQTSWRKYANRPRPWSYWFWFTLTCMLLAGLFLGAGLPVLKELRMFDLLVQEYQRGAVLIVNGQYGEAMWPWFFSLLIAIGGLVAIGALILSLFIVLFGPMFLLLITIASVFSRSVERHQKEVSGNIK